MNLGSSQLLAAEWKRWIVESKFSGVADDEILKELMRHGVSRGLAKIAIAAISKETSLQVGLETTQYAQHLAAILRRQAECAALRGAQSEIQRVKHLDRSSFLQNFCYASRPIIFPQMAQNWPALSKWVPEYFSTQFGDVEVEVQAGRSERDDYEVNPRNHRHLIKFSKYVNLVLSNGKSNDYYMTAGNANFQNPALQSLLQDVFIPQDFQPQRLEENIYLWFGSAGTLTPLHWDGGSLMMAQIYGRKKWWLIAPEQTPYLYPYHSFFSPIDCRDVNVEQYPEAKNIRILEAILQPGDVLFVPVGWWHQVSALDTSISLSWGGFSWDVL
jgi:hypothetical protein